MFFFHNLERYDSHIFVNDLVDNSEKKKFSVIPHTNEKFMSITYGCVKLLDSLKFLVESLDGCASSFKDEDYVFLKEKFKKTIIYSRKSFHTRMITLKY